MTKREMIRLLQEARDDIWEGSLQFERDFQTAWFPAQVDGRLTVNDVHRARMFGICNGFDAALEALRENSRFPIKAQARKVSRWGASSVHVDKIQAHEVERDRRTK